MPYSALCPVLVFSLVHHAAALFSIYRSGPLRHFADNDTLAEVPRGVKDAGPLARPALEAQECISVAAPFSRWAELMVHDLRAVPLGQARALQWPALGFDGLKAWVPSCGFGGPARVRPRSA